jgi:predicted nucleic acid-binding protein
LTLVLDANVVVPACRVDAGFRRFAHEPLVAPPLMWPEARSTLHEAMWRGELPAEQASTAFARLEHAPVKVRDDPRLGAEAWRLAGELDWAKTYDAEYLALASLLDCRFVTLDARLHRGAAHLGFVVSPTEL